MDIIHLLPDAVANQIAAGEVVQRPASVVKELVENAIDAGASDIQIVITDAGRTLIQVIDDGKGMSATDARMAFERHATSKIRQATDLYTLSTMGFRGEALPSIVAVSQVELTTRTPEAEVGTKLYIEGSQVKSQETVSCPQGTNIAVKNLFFNIPARRKFLKTNATEFACIEKTFYSIALVYPQTAFTLIHNGQICYKLKSTTLKERIYGVFGAGTGDMLCSLGSASTEVAKIYGFTGKPETAKKQNDKQYFFVNGRYMRHPVFQKAVIEAYDRLIQPGTKPSFFIYFEVSPANIDVNAHPTKTEIKFTDENVIYPLLRAAVREAIGRCELAGRLDFDNPAPFTMPSYTDLPKNVQQPKIHTTPGFDPFKSSGANGGGGSGATGRWSQAKAYIDDWQKLYNDFENGTGTDPVGQDNGQDDGQDDVAQSAEGQGQEGPTWAGGLLPEAEGEKPDVADLSQLGQRYILAPCGRKLMLIEQHRAHYRVMYEKLMQAHRQQEGQSPSQKLMYPEQIELSAAKAQILTSLTDYLVQMGYDIEARDETTFSINGTPAGIEQGRAQKFIDEVLDDVANGQDPDKEGLFSTIVMAQARTAAIEAGRRLTLAEMAQLVTDLFKCPQHNTAPDGKRIIEIIDCEEIDRRFR